MDRWCGKVAIVTGASSGIGAAIAEQLVEAGLIVVGLARRVEKVEAISKKLSNKKGKLHAYKTDMTKEEDILKAFKWTTQNLGPIHILINNAGIVVNNGLINGATADWRRLFDTNLLGLCIATREAVKNMMENKVDGHIVHINSISGHKTISSVGVYGPSKHAVTDLTEVLRMELNEAKSKIKISSVSPGAVNTEIFSTFDLPAEFGAIPMLASKDIADAVLYILGTPPNVQIHELMIKPVNEMF